jgi:hypothetical protein
LSIFTPSFRRIALHGFDAYADGHQWNSSQLSFLTLSVFPAPALNP